MTTLTFHVTGDLDGTEGATLHPSRDTHEPLGLLVLAHGAGAGRQSPFMTGYAAALAARGLDVVTFDFPYVQARRRAPDRAPVLEEAFRRTIVAAAAHPRVRGRRLFIGGKSMGGRIATHLAATPDRWPDDAPRLDGVVVFGYPLTPPGGRGSGDRVSHLHRIAAPTLIVQGTRDSFGGPDAVRAALASGDAPTGGRAPIDVMAVEGGDHSFAVRKSSGRTQESVRDEVISGVIAWVRRTADQ
jgi:predicted alpha/beta-hydrolase family hydrolase